MPPSCISSAFLHPFAPPILCLPVELPSNDGHLGLFESREVMIGCSELCSSLLLEIPVLASFRSVFSTPASSSDLYFMSRLPLPRG
jgi:hypothetical protein